MCMRAYKCRHTHTHMDFFLYLKKMSCLFNFIQAVISQVNSTNILREWWLCWLKRKYFLPWTLTFGSINEWMNEWSFEMNKDAFHVTSCQIKMFSGNVKIHFKVNLVSGKWKTKKMGKFIFNPNKVMLKIMLAWMNNYLCKEDFTSHMLNYQSLPYSKMLSLKKKFLTMWSLEFDITFKITFKINF